MSLRALKSRGGGPAVAMVAGLAACLLRFLSPLGVGKLREPLLQELPVARGKPVDHFQNLLNICRTHQYVILLRAR